MHATITGSSSSIISVNKQQQQQQQQQQQRRRGTEGAVWQERDAAGRHRWQASVRAKFRQQKVEMTRLGVGHLKIDMWPAPPSIHTRITEPRFGMDQLRENVPLFHRFALTESHRVQFQFRLRQHVAGRAPHQHSHSAAQTHRKVEVLTHPQWKSRSGGFYVSERRKVPDWLRAQTVAKML